MKIGLALGGGSARGLAHIPMLEVFDELGLKPTVIAGCSIGALVGAGYASGMRGKDIRDHATKLLSNRIDMARHIFGARQTRLRDILSLKGLMSLHLSGEKLVEVVLPEAVPQLLEDLKIPLKVIATNYNDMEEVVFTTGPVIQAIGASIAIPGLIAGPRINGKIHVDGGVKNPVPFNHVLDGMDLVVAVDVTGRPKPFRRAHPSNLELAVGSLLITFNQLAELRRQHAPPDIYIVPEIDQFGAGDFFKVKDIFAACEPAKDRLKREIEIKIKSIT